MIPMTSDTRVWLVTGHTDMRKGYQSLALHVQEALEARSALIYVSDEDMWRRDRSPGNSAAMVRSAAT